MSVLRTALLALAPPFMACELEQPAPLAVGIVHDDQHELTLKQIDRLLDFCRGRECHLAFTTIEDFAKPLTQVEIKKVQGSFRERLQTAEQNAKSTIGWKIRIATSILAIQQPPVRKDLLGSLVRMDFFFSQNPGARRVLILACQAVHTGPQREKPKLPKDAWVITIGSNTKELFQDAVLVGSVDDALELVELRSKEK